MSGASRSATSGGRTIRQKALAGLKWSAVGALFTTAMQFGQLVGVARLLPPDSFGVLAILTVVMGFSQAFMDAGLSNALIQRSEVSAVQLSSLYWINIAAGLVFAGVLILLAPILAAAFQEPRLEAPLRYLAAIFVLFAIGNQYRALLKRNLQFRILALIDIGAATVSLIIAITLAHRGHDYYSIVFAMIASSAIAGIALLCIGSYLFQPPSLTYRHSSLTGFLSFGLYQMGERSINYLSANIDKILIGKFLGMQAVGFYNMAWQFTIFPITRLNPIVNAVAFPVYSRLQHDQAALSRYYLFTVHALCMVTVPLLAFLTFFAHDVTRLLLGEGWETTARLTAILSLVSMHKAIGNPGGALLLAKGHVRVGFWWTIAWSCTMCLTLAVGLHLVPRVEAAPFILLASFFTVGWGWHRLIAKYGQVPLRPLLSGVFQLALVSLALSLLASIAVSLLGVSTPLNRVLVGIAAAGGSYALYLSITERETFRALRLQTADKMA